MIADDKGAVEHDFGDTAEPKPRLHLLCASYEDVQKARIALAQRGITQPSEALKKVEDHLGRAIKTELRQHVLWPWLEAQRGLGGIQIARLISLIGDPRRFPGQGCLNGHAFVPDYVVGQRCPVMLVTGQCEATVVERTGSGVRPLWRYLGLDVVEGHSPKRRKGVRSHWSPEGRTMLLMPRGVADQIVTYRIQPYYDLYLAAKTRKLGDDATDDKYVLDGNRGGVPLIHMKAPPTNPLRSIMDVAGSPPSPGVSSIIEVAGMPLIRAHRIGRVVAVKALVGDLLTHWKTL